MGAANGMQARQDSADPLSAASFRIARTSQFAERLSCWLTISVSRSSPKGWQSRYRWHSCAITGATWRTAAFFPAIRFRVRRPRPWRNPRVTRHPEPPAGRKWRRASAIQRISETTRKVASEGATMLLIEQNAKLVLSCKPARLRDIERIDHLGRRIRDFDQRPARAAGVPRRIGRLCEAA